MKNIKLFIVFLSLFFLGDCNKKDKSKLLDMNVQGEHQNSLSYKFDNGSENFVVEVSKIPQKAVLYSHFMTEMLLALGLEDRIVLGTTEGEILPEFAKAYEKVPNKIIGHHAIVSKESFLLMNADFVSGWDEAIRAETTGAALELYERGIYPFTVKSIRDGATLDTVYEDFMMIGKIFAVEDRAVTLVNNLKIKLSDAEKNFIIPENKKNVLVFSSIKNGIYVSGGLTTDLINRAGGKNVYDELGADHEMVSYESLVHRNPDIIFIASTAEGMSFEEKLKFIRKHPALRELSAVKNNNVHSITLEDISPGVRNVDFIIKMNRLMYEQK